MGNWEIAYVAISLVRSSDYLPSISDSSILSFSIFHTRLVSPASEQVIHSAGNFETPFLPRAIFSPSPDHLFNLLRVIEGRLDKPREIDVLRRSSND